MMAKRKTKGKQQGQEGFTAWYQEQWQERWETLYESLLQPHSHVAWWNPSCKLSPDEVFGSSSPKNHLAELLPGCWPTQNIASIPTDEDGIPAYYLLDAASVMAARQLDVQPEDQVLDLCAAPGGKSLILASALGQQGRLTANDASKNRFHRLRRVLSSYLPPSVFTQQIKTTHFDATRWCLYEQNAYDKILLDAPCSSERHVLADTKEIERWSPARSRQLAFRQYAMLASALEVVRIGGKILYSTCSISALENDQVIKRLQKKKKQRTKILPLDLPHTTETDCGAWILPDEGGWGPIYLCLIERIS